MLKINTCAYPKLVLRRLIKSKKCHFIASLEKNVIAKKKKFTTWKKNTGIRANFKFLNYHHNKGTGIIQI